jgi:hypothetical protein
MKARERVTLRRLRLTVNDWLRYVDRESVFDPAGSSIVTERLSHISIGELDEVGWESEEWSINAYIVPLGQGKKVEALLRDPSFFGQTLDMRFGPGWNGRAFDFGECETIAGIDIEPWVQIWNDPVTSEPRVEPRSDFVRYHALRERGPYGSREYRHPLDEVPVLSVAIEEVAFYKPTPYVTVHRSYLRDYLAARNAALLLSVVADRFVIASSRDELAIPEEGELTIAPGVSCRIDVYPLGRDAVRARSSLYWTLVVKPAEEPDYNRTPWPFYEHLRKRRGDAGAPTFIVDAEGTRKSASAYKGVLLYFKPTVLERYLNGEAYSVVFITRTWGGASGPRDTHVDVGMNEKGLLTAFAPDIAKLSISEQMYWAHHSVAPDGGACYDWFMARMQCRPVNSPGVTELLERATTRLQSAWAQRFGGEIYRATEPDEEKAQERDRRRLTVGPVTGQFGEIRSLAKALYEAIVEPLNVRSLRASLKSADVEFEKDERSLGLLQRVLVDIVGLPQDEVRNLMGPQRLLNELRVASAHTLTGDIEGSLKKAGVRYDRPDPRAAWDAVVDAVVTSIEAISEAIAASEARPSVRRSAAKQ